MVVPPVYVLVAARLSVPSPCLVNAAAALTAQAVQTGAAPADGLLETMRAQLGRAAEALSSVGWTTGRIDNAALGTPSTTVYVPPGLDDQAALLLDGFPALTRTRPAFEGLALDALTLVLAEPDASSVVEQMEQRATGDVPIASQSAP